MKYSAINVVLQYQFQVSMITYISFLGSLLFPTFPNEMGLICREFVQEYALANLYQQIIKNNYIHKVFISRHTITHKPASLLKNILRRIGVPR